MEYKLENLEGNKYILSGDSKYVKKKILKLFNRSNIVEFKVHEIEIVEYITVNFDANLDQMTKLKKLLKRLK
tara:strand:- start:306 stop:521 length:216 start_codon:yes stop_codon:yes gene_type:complete